MTSIVNVPLQSIYYANSVVLRSCMWQKGYCLGTRDMGEPIAT